MPPASAAPSDAGIQPYAEPPSFAGWPPQGAVGDPTAAAALRKAQTALGWAIGAAVGAGLALIGLLVVLVVDGSGGLGGAEEDYYYETLRGEVVGLPAGSPLSGDRLERPIVDLLREYGIDEVEISCPDTPSVSVSTVVACTGGVDGYEWTGVVVFEDDKGSFAVIEL